MPAGSSFPLTRVGVHSRRLGASAARVWENVRDWEHLPWLHGATFRSIALEDEGDWGWRARVGLAPAPAGAEILLELRLLLAESRYVARTLAGPGAGSEIRTQVHARDDASSDVEVEFWLPGVAPERAAALGAACTTLYRRLWDEDEAMMIRRAEVLARGRQDGTIACPWHGWRFDVRSGRSADGRRARLPAPPRVVIDAEGEVRLTVSDSPPRSRHRSASRC